ncbi:MAG: glycine cleavage T C-terminal barrel domain-containing protein [Caldilineaceae bacterium]
MMTIEQTLAQTEITSLRDGAALHLRPNGGVLRLTDTDRHDFLHRMTTNNINALKPGQSAVTVLTSPTARIVFVFTVVCRADDLLLLPALGEAAALERHLRGQIFFMDKVKVRNVSADYARFRLMGPQASVALTALNLDLAQAPEGAWQAQNDLLAVKQGLYDVPGYEVILPTAQLQTTVDALRAAGVTLLADETAYHARRVELGRPSPGYELTGDYNPLEAGLAWACADNKGCYTGQEIIARQITYNKVTKTLVGLRSAQALTAGATLTVDGREVGNVSSVAYSQALSASIALAIVKRPHNEPGNQLDAGGVMAEVVALPLVDESL